MRTQIQNKHVHNRHQVLANLWPYCAKMSKSKILAADELDTILRQIINSESGEIDKKLVKNTLSDKILNGDRRQIELILKAIFVNDRPRPLQQLIE